MQKLDIFLPGRIPSKKNSMVHIVRKWSMVKFPSKNYQKREKEMLIFLTQEKIPKAKANKVSIWYSFVRPDRRKADITNKMESINDMLVKYWFIEDDAREFLDIKYAKTKSREPKNPWVHLEIEYERDEWYEHPAMDRPKKKKVNSLFEAIQD